MDERNKISRYFEFPCSKSEADFRLCNSLKDRLIECLA